MALAASPASFAEVMDPHEILEWVIPCGPLLEAGEEIDTFDLTLYAEAIALGLTILDSGDGYPDPVLSNGNQDVTVWFEIATAYENNVAFDGTGTALAMNIHLVTNSSPARERDRDIVLTVAQQ